MVEPLPELFETHWDKKEKDAEKEQEYLYL